MGDLGGPCPRCNEGTITIKKNAQKKEGLIWSCTKKTCYQTYSVRHNSWFEASHLNIATILKLTFLWCHKLPQKFVTSEFDLSSATSVDWYNMCREVCICVLEDDNKQIGGPGKVVEIDESKFGKRKFHKGRRVDGCWVFGGIERESKESFFSVVEKRDADTLIPIILKYVRPGTTIMSDCWKAYSSLDSLGYVHKTVNHSKEFVDSETGACTNTIESTWHALKLSLPRSGTQKRLYDSYFEEYVARRRYMVGGADRFIEFLKLVHRVYPGTRKERVIQAEEYEEPEEPEVIRVVEPVDTTVIMMDHSYCMH